MRRILFLWMVLISAQVMAAPVKPINLMIAAATISAKSVTVVWDKPEVYKDIIRYHLFLNGKQIGTTNKCNFKLDDLHPASHYKLIIKAEDKTGALSAASNRIKFITQKGGKTLNILNFGAKGDNATLNTKAIQKAIDACPAFGTVLIPKGTFVSGALFLKSNMTLKIEKGGELKGSRHLEDYLPMIHNRFEGWELMSYASLINAGVMNHNGGFSVENLRICGQGAITGAGGALGTAMKNKSGIRSRGRLILLMNCKNVDLQGLTIQNSPCWTIQYVYCEGVSLHGMDIKSTAHNGDGIDPDSSDDSFIFNCCFSTGDDCIAIKSGKNPEGNRIGKPTRRVRITDCNFIKGHGVSIGSEMSGGVSDVLVRDCQAGPLLHGLQIKGTKQRGGYVKNVRVLDCQLQQITIFSKLPYNNDGQAAPEIPTFSDYVFKNLDLSSSKQKGPAIDIHGFEDPNHKLRNVIFSDVLLPANATVSVNDAEDVIFTNVRTTTGAKPEYEIKRSTDVIY